MPGGVRSPCRSRIPHDRAALPPRARRGRHVVEEAFRFHEPARGGARVGARDGAEGPEHCWEVWRVEAAGTGAAAGGRETRTGARLRTAREAEAWIADRDGPPDDADDADDAGGAGDADDAGGAADAGGT